MILAFINRTASIQISYQEYFHSGTLSNFEKILSNLSVKWFSR
jgi:hypothetical protein